MTQCTKPCDSIPDLVWRFLSCPRCGQALTSDPAELLCASCGGVGEIREGILRFHLTKADPSIAWYRNRGGAHFFERSDIAYSMSSLDTPVYHEYLAELRPAHSDAVIIDVGAGDGRNTLPWLGWGFARVIATDAVFASLDRFHNRLRAEHPEWLNRLVLIECDSRQLPLSKNSGDLVIAIESLYYLNEDYGSGLSQCRRILKPSGRLLLAERSWEGALFTRLLYGGIRAMLSLDESRDMWDGAGEDRVRSRCFTEEELLTVIRVQGLMPLETKGMSLFSLLLGYLRGEGKLREEDRELLPQVHALIRKLGNDGGTRRTHVIVARKSHSVADVS